MASRARQPANKLAQSRDSFNTEVAQQTLMKLIHSRPNPFILVSRGWQPMSLAPFRDLSLAEGMGESLVTRMGAGIIIVDCVYGHFLHECGKAFII